KVPTLVKGIETGVPVVAVSGLSANNIAPQLSALLKVAVAFPDEPSGVGSVVHAAPTEALLPSFASSTSVSGPGDAVVQLLKVLSLPTATVSITAAYAVLVIIGGTVIAVPFPVVRVVLGSTSKGPPGLPDASKPPVTSTPEKATIPPAPAFAFMFN